MDPQMIRAGGLSAAGTLRREYEEGFLSYF